MVRVMRVYGRPADRVGVAVAPQLAGWETAGHAGQLLMSDFLDGLELLAAPLVAGVQGRMAVELAVGLADGVPLAGQGQDLDSYLYPVAQRLGPGRLAAVFGRRTRGPSWLAVGPAVATEVPVPAMFSTRMGGSYERADWRQTLYDRLRDAGVPPAGPGAVRMELVLTTGPGRNWANLWRPLLACLGPVLGEDPARPFHPAGDRITSLGLHHAVTPEVGHDVLIDACWEPAGEPPAPS
jgi:hypothetical protein